MIELNQVYNDRNWIFSVKCDFDKEPRIWRYHYDENDPDDWTAKPSFLTYSVDRDKIEIQQLERESLKLRAEKLKLAFGDLRSQLGIDRQDDFFEWLNGDMNQDIGFPDKEASIIFNHIVTSHRTSALTMLVSVVHSHRITELRGLLPGQPCWFYTPHAGIESNFIYETTADTDPAWKVLLQQYALAYPELFFQKDSATNKIICKSDVDECFGEFLKAHRQLTNISILKYRVEQRSCTLQLKFDMTLCHYHRGSICGCIPIPGKPTKRKPDDKKEPNGVYSPEVVISSPLASKALSSLSDIWQDKAEAVLISGPPGAGKDNLALSIPYGSGRKIDKEKHVLTISLANGTTHEQERQILGYQQDDGTIVDGLLAKAKESAVFIDEAHYPEKKIGARASLLRVLEAKEYYPVGSMDIKKVEDVQLIFASSLPLEGRKGSLAKVRPVDFWTRMTHVIRIDHPLDQRAYRAVGIRQYKKISDIQNKVLMDLFCFFWWERTKSHFGIDPVTVLSENNEANDIREEDSAEQIKKGYIYMLLNFKQLKDIAKIFAEDLMNEIGSRSLVNVSIRGIRSMVSRLFSRCVADVTSGMWQKEFGVLFLEPGEDIDQDEVNRIRSEQLPKIRERVCEIIREIQQIACLNS